MSSSIVIMSEPVTAKLNEKKAFLKCAFFSICLSASSIVYPSPLKVLEKVSEVCY